MTTESIVGMLKGRKRLIFTITTGRSGTAYLARILALVPGVACYHEPEPRFSDIMRAVQQDSRVATEFWIQKKLPAIERSPAPIYIETSHLSCKGFIEPLLALDLVPDLILLSRDHRSVARSLYQMQSIPGRSTSALHFYLSPTDPDVLPLPDWQNLHDYQLCYWYCLEIERRGEYYSTMLAQLGAKIARLTFAEMLTARGILGVIKALDLPSPNLFSWLRYFLHKGGHVNSKTTAKAKYNVALPPDDVLDELEEEVLSRCSSENVSIIHDDH